MLPSPTSDPKKLKFIKENSSIRPNVKIPISSPSLSSLSISSPSLSSSSVIEGIEMEKENAFHVQLKLSRNSSDDHSNVDSLQDSDSEDFDELLQYAKK